MQQEFLANGSALVMVECAMQPGSSRSKSGMLEAQLLPNFPTSAQQPGSPEAEPGALEAQLLADFPAASQQAGSSSEGPVVVVARATQAAMVPALLGGSQSEAVPLRVQLQVGRLLLACAYCLAGCSLGAC